MWCIYAICKEYKEHIWKDKRNGHSRDCGASALMPAVFDTLQHDVAVHLVV